jgi:4-hydroxybenzoate polyprenyltransferase
LPSAVADVLGGVLIGARGWPAGSGPWLLLAGSVCVYLGGLALNDWADRAHDAATRPERPLPAGAVSPGAALLVAAALLVGGVACGLAADAVAGRILAAVAACAALYDLAGRGPLLGPLLLGLCRAGNLGAAVVLGCRAIHREPGWLLVVPVTYGLYVVLVSVLGRMEDGEDERPVGPRPRHLLNLAGPLLLVPLAVAAAELGATSRTEGLLALWACFAVSLFAARAVFRTANQKVRWTRPLVMRAMGVALSRLHLHGLALCLAATVGGAGHAGWLAALVLVLLVPAGGRLRRIFPPS